MPKPASNRTTALERAIAGNGASRPTPIDALGLARRHWVTGERLDMGRLAQDLGISRATLYSWVGSKERLIGEVIWSYADDGMRQARAAATGTGADYIVDVFERFARLNAAFEPLRRFIEQDAELALRVLTSKDSPVQGRMIAVARDLLVAQVEAGALAPALDIETLAYTMVRVAESFLYSDIIAGSEPDVDKAVAVVQVLLHAPPVMAPRAPRKRTKRRGNSGP